MNFAYCSLKNTGIHSTIVVMLREKPTKSIGRLLGKCLRNGMEELWKKIKRI